MNEEEIIKLWKSGLSKNTVAVIYRRMYNNHIKIIRSSVRHRHSGRMLTSKEALSRVEQVIYRYVRERR